MIKKGEESAVKARAEAQVRQTRTPPSPNTPPASGGDLHSYAVQAGEQFYPRCRGRARSAPRSGCTAPELTAIR